MVNRDLEKLLGAIILMTLFNVVLSRELKVR
jgi:hypothetical protein